MLKTLTYDGPGHELIVPGQFVLEQGKSIDIPADLADALIRANPHLHLSVVDSTVDKPPHVGPGSGKQAWSDYAATLGIATDGLTRDEIIAAVDAAADTTLPEGEPVQPEAQTGEGHDNHDQEE